MFRKLTHIHSAIFIDKDLHYIIERKIQKLESPALPALLVVFNGWIHFFDIFLIYKSQWRSAENTQIQQECR